jgi:hypothetical protein
VEDPHEGANDTGRRGDGLQCVRSCRSTTDSGLQTEAYPCPGDSVHPEGANGERAPSSRWKHEGGVGSLRRLTPFEVQFVCQTNWAGGQGDVCNLAVNHPLSESSKFGGATVAASHRTQNACASCDPDCDWREGSDSVAVLLKHGWVLAGYAWWWWKNDTYAGYVYEPTGFSETATGKTTQAWGVQTCHGSGAFQGLISYRVDLYAIGSKGVPLK